MPILVIATRVRESASPAAIDLLTAGAAETQAPPQESGDPSGATLRDRVRALHEVSGGTQRGADQS